MLDSPVQQAEETELEPELQLAFAPLHKRCLGVAVGVTTGLVIFLATLVHLVRSPGEPYPLVLLQQFFSGYSVSVAGAFIGLLWGFALGFLIGWAFAFVRNFALSASALVFRARAELAEHRGFLDHI